MEHKPDHDSLAMKPTTKIDYRLLFSRSFRYFIPLTGLILIVLWVIYSAEERGNRALIEGHEKIHVSELAGLITNDFTGIISNLQFLAEQHELQRVLEKETNGKKELTSNLLSFSRNNVAFDQVRFIDQLGMEIIRINLNQGKPKVIPDEELQSKYHRYYFQDMINLERGQIYVSPLDLNIERGQVEYPLKPMIRFGTPVFDKDGQKRGAIVLNYLGANMLAKLETHSSIMPGQIMLLNSSGYWLKGINPEDEWGFMHKGKQNITFGNRYPESWKRILGEDSGQFYHNQNLFSFATIYPLSKQNKSSNGSGMVRGPSQKALNENEYYWKIVSRVSPETITKNIEGSTRRFQILSIVLVSIIAGVSLLLNRSSLLKKQTEEELRATQFTVDHIDEAVFWTDASARIIYVNDICCKNLGYRREELMTKTIFDFDETITKHTWYQHWKKLKNRGSITFESEFLTQEGKVFPVEIMTNFIRYKRQEINCAFARDITKKKLTERNVKLDEERLRAIISLNQMNKSDELELLEYAVEKAIRLSDSTYGYLHFVTEDQKMLEHRVWSKQALQRCDLKSPETYHISEAKIWGECINQKEPIVQNSNTLLKEEVVFPENHLEITRHLCIPIMDGEKVAALCGLGNKIVPYDQTDVEQITLFMNSVWVIVKDKRAEKELAISEKKFRHLINNIDAGVVVHSPDGNVQMINEKALKLLELPRNQAIGLEPKKPGWELIREDGSTIAQDDYPANLVIRTKIPLRNYVVGIRSPGKRTPIWLLFNGYPEFSDGQVVNQVTITFIDITERKKVAEALQQRIEDQIKSRQEILEMMEDLNSAKKKAEDRYIALQREVRIRNEMENELRRNVAELERFRKLAVGREERMIKLKEEINALRTDKGHASKYKIVS